MKDQAMTKERLMFLGCLILAVMTISIMLIAAPVLADRGQRSEPPPIIIGGDYNYPPYEFLGENGEPAGYNVDLTWAIAEVMGMDVEIRLGPWGEIRKALEDGEIDAIHGMFYSEERDKVVDFSPPHTIVYHAIFARQGSPAIESVEELRGKEIIVMRGDIMHDYVLENGLSDNPVLVETQADALRLLASGEHDYAMVAKLPGLYWVRELELSNVVTVGPPIRPSEYCYAVREGNGALLARLSEGMAILKETGRYREITDKWLGVLEPRGIAVEVVLRYTALVLLPLLLLLASAGLWSWSLRRRVAQRTEELGREITERVRAEEKIEHLNLVLRAIRSVNQIIAKGKDRDRLLQGACESLIETRGYHNAWIAVMDEMGGLVTTAEAGLGKGFAPLVEQLKSGELPACGRMALSQPGVVVTEDPPSACADCPLAVSYAGRGAMTIRLEHGGKVYGLLSVSIPAHLVADAEEQVLFEEVAADIAFALHSIELEEERVRAEEALQERVKELTCLYAVSRDMQGDLSLDELCRQVIEHLIPAMQFSEITAPVIELDDRRFTSERHTEELSHGLQAEIRVRGEARGRLWVYYAEDRPFLIPEEQSFLNTVAEALGLWLEHKQAEEALRVSEERFTLAVQGSNAGLWDWDILNNSLYWSPRLKELLGYADDELDVDFDTFESLLHPDDREHTGAAIEAYLKDRGLYDMEQRLRTKSGEYRWFRARGQALWDEAGNPLRMIGFTTDITERKRAEGVLKEYSERLEEMVEERTKELRDAQERLVRREKLAVLGQLAGGVGHELRNPLGVISNAVYFLQMTLPDADETTREYLDIITSEVRLAGQIVSDLLDFSRTRPAERQEIAVFELVAQVLAKQPPPENVKVTTQIAPDLPPAFVDPRQIGQVLVNLVTNAYQAMPEGGELTIETSPKPGWVSISVTDTGCGISPENMAKLFEPLFTTRARGIGLGLAVSKSLVEANGGSIEVESEMGKGSTFTVRLPTREVVA